MASQSHYMYQHEGDKVVFQSLADGVHTKKAIDTEAITLPQYRYKGIKIPIVHDDFGHIEAYDYGDNHLVYFCTTRSYVNKMEQSILSQFPPEYDNAYSNHFELLEGNRVRNMHHIMDGEELRFRYTLFIRSHDARFAFKRSNGKSVEERFCELFTFQML